MENQTWCSPSTLLELYDQDIVCKKERYGLIPCDHMQAPSIRKIYLSSLHAVCIMKSPSTEVYTYMGKRPISVLTPVDHCKGLTENAAVAFNAHESIVCLGGETISLLNTGGSSVGKLQPGEAVKKIDAHPNNASEIMSSSAHDIHIWDMVTQQAKQKMHCQSTISDAIYSPQGTMIATQENYCNGSSTVVMRDLRTSNTTSKTFSIPYNKKRFSLCLSKGLHCNPGETLLAVADTQKIALFDIRTDALFDIRVDRDRIRRPNLMPPHNWTEVFFAASNKLIGVHGKKLYCLDTDTEIIAQIDIAKVTAFYNTSWSQRSKQLSVWSPKDNYAYVYDFSQLK
jgi:WD40 repeat protein